MGNDNRQKYSVKMYNLDVILSVGYRVNCKNAVLFRRWASSVLKEYLLKGYAMNHCLLALENRFIEYEHRLDEYEKKIDFFVWTSLPPVEGVFFDTKYPRPLPDCG